MVFLPGNHVLDVNITVANVASLTMRRESSSGNVATVVCNGSVGLSFTSMADFKIQCLAFTFFGRDSGSTSSNNKSALLLNSITYGELINCSFHDNFGTPLVVNNTNITLAGNEFSHNVQCGYNSGDGNILIGGSAIIAVNSNLTFTGNTTLRKNDVSCPEIYRSPPDGGAIKTTGYTVLNFHGISNFINNSADGKGGAIFTSGHTVVSFNGTSKFINNSADHGGAIYTSYNTVLSFNGISTFSNNSAEGGIGGAIYMLYKKISFNGTNNFTGNSAYYGGAMYTTGVISFNGISNFISNSAGYSGGAISTSRSTVLSFNGTNNFINNFIHRRGGAIYTSERTVLSFSGTSNFINNSASNKGQGGTVYANYNTEVTFSGTNNFINNSAGFGGTLLTQNYAVINFNGANNFFNNSAHYYDDGDGGVMYMYDHSIVSLNGMSNFNNNTAGADGGAIHALDNAAVYFNGSNNFFNNLAEKGGALYLNKSTFSILPNATVLWENNHAKLGGAIYVDDQSNPFVYCTQANICTRKDICFFQLPGQNLSNPINVQLVFKNNSADDAGSVLYGGAIDNCTFTGMGSYSSGEVFNMLVYIDNDNTNSSISSPTFRIRPCENNHPHFSTSSISYTVYPGETFYVSVGAFGQRNGTVHPSGVRCYITTGNLQGFQYIQIVVNTCTTFNYTVFSLSPANPAKHVYIDLYADGPCSTFSDKLAIQLTIYQTCPPGFSLSEPVKACICEPRLATYTNNCNITNGVGRIKRNSGERFWVGYDNQSDGLILHPLCPFDYCVSYTVAFPLNNTDKQCAHNRAGLLCGACKNGYSLVLGASHCQQCTNSHIALLIPFAVMGIALILLLFYCKLTAATGMLSGVVFYANIVGANRTIFLPVESTDAFSVFTAWLNLDFGIETCFYNEMDAYSKTWLQFVFPVYIWLLVGLMILVSNYSQRFANLLGNNPVSVLATLILLSYAKILRTLITVLYNTFLEYPTNNRSVWLYDANIEYLTGKHIPLFIVAVLVFLFLFLPYTLLLLLGQWLQALSHLRLFTWVNSARLKPFMDSYHAPYKAKHRYWPGLLLMLRFVLLLVFAIEFNPQQDRSINLLAILVGSGMLVVWAWISSGVYKNWCLNALEGSFALNLIILAASTMYIYHVSHSEGLQLAIGYTSVSIALATFIGILVFQLANVTGIIQYLKRAFAALKGCIIPIRDGEIECDADSLPDRLINPDEYELVSQSSAVQTAAEPMESELNERRLTPVYTYSSPK